jgi:hypothetical protein
MNKTLPKVAFLGAIELGALTINGALHIASTESL